MEKYKISEDCLLEIVAQKRKLVELVNSSYYGEAASMKLLNCMYPRMENILYCWYLLQNKMFSVQALATKAKEILELTAETPAWAYRNNSTVFKGSKNWAYAFKTRYNIGDYERLVATDPEDSVETVPTEPVVEQIEESN